MRVIEHKLTREEAIRYFRSISNKVRDYAWSIHQLQKYQKANSPDQRKKVLPKKNKPSNQCGTQIQGVANNLGKFDFSKHVPDYDKTGQPRESVVSLDDRCLLLQEELKGYISTYHNS